MIFIKITSKIKKKGSAVEPLLKAIDDICKERKKIEKCAEAGLAEFIKASPNQDIASHWSYEIISTKNKVYLIFNNDTEIIEGFHYTSDGKLDDATKRGTNIAIVVDVGHGTKDGRWIPGKHYLSQATENAFTEISKSIEEDLRSYE